MSTAVAVRAEAGRAGRGRRPAAGHQAFAEDGGGARAAPLPAVHAPPRAPRLLVP
ncbi:hypothetical protein [Streptomyces marincola]|uniref:hypothetical protein n=1 Tax=Streptomyces marincola TaxID=2878388 RepID=UPI00131DD2DB|nr:hypothetical protein [Streptomyces marincola]